MKKFLTMLLALSVVFTYTFGAAGSVFAASALTDAEQTSLYQTEAKVYKTYTDKLDSLKAYYTNNAVDVKSAFTGSVGTANPSEPTISKEAVATIIDSIFEVVDDQLAAVHTTLVQEIGTKTVTSTSGSAQSTLISNIGAGSDTPADWEAYFEEAIGNKYTALSTVAGINSAVFGNTAAAAFKEIAFNAEFAVQKAAALEKINSVNLGMYDETKPEAVSYGGDKYYSAYEIATAILAQAKKDLAAIKYVAGEPLATTAGKLDGDINAVATKVVKEDANTAGVYYVKANAVGDGYETVADFMKSKKDSTLLVTKADTETANKTLAEVKAYEIDTMKGRLALQKSAERKRLNGLLTSGTDVQKKAATTALAKIDTDFANIEKVLTAVINQQTSDIFYSSGSSPKTYMKGTKTLQSYIATAVYDVDRDAANPVVTDVETILAAVAANEATAVEKKAEKSYNGTPIYNADAVDYALAMENAKAYAQILDAPGTWLTSYWPTPLNNLVKAEMVNVIGANASSTVVIDKVTYDTIKKWEAYATSTNYDAAQLEAVTAEIEKAYAAIRAAKTVADVDAAFLAAVDAIKAIDTKAVNTDYTLKNAAKIASYAAKLDAALAAKIAAVGGATEFGKIYSLDTNLVNIKATLNTAYNDADLEALYQEALKVIENLKTKAELSAEAKAINDAILAIKAPITTANKAEVVELKNKVADFTAYKRLIGDVTAYNLLTSLLTSYVNSAKGLDEDAIDKLVAALPATTAVKVSDEAAINAVIKAFADYEAVYGAEYDDNNFVDYNPAGDFTGSRTAYLTAVVTAKIAAVQKMIADIDPSAKPLDTAAIEAARAAYDALGENGIAGGSYDKLLSLENLAAATEDNNAKLEEALKAAEEAKAEAEKAKAEAEAAAKAAEEAKAEAEKAAADKAAAEAAQKEAEEKAAAAEAAKAEADKAKAEAEAAQAAAEKALADAQTKIKVMNTTAKVSKATATKKSVKLTFAKPAVGANGYKVYMATSKTGTYKLVGTVTGTTFTKKSLKSGKTYYFKVKAYKTVAGAKVYTKTSAIKTVKTK